MSEQETVSVPVVKEYDRGNNHNSGQPGGPYPKGVARTPWQGPVTLQQQPPQMSELARRQMQMGSINQ